MKKIKFVCDNCGFTYTRKIVKMTFIDLIKEHDFNKDIIESIHVGICNNCI